MLSEFFTHLNVIFKRWQIGDIYPFHITHIIYQCFMEHFPSGLENVEIGTV